MTVIALLSREPSIIELLTKAFAETAPDQRVALAGEDMAAEAEVALCWYPPVGSLAALPKLRLIHSIGAGVDHLENDPTRPVLPVCRVVDPGHRLGMVEYVRWAALHYHRSFDRVLAQQRELRWSRPVQRPASQYRIGVMGLGKLGAAVAADLASVGYEVRGWARHSKAIDLVNVFAGDELFTMFLDQLDLLVNLLPLTPHTKAVLCAANFARLAPGAAVVNCGRGAHMVAEDIITSLASGQLNGALLDVFETEPLPADHPLWTTPGVVVTPHMASVTVPSVIVRQVVANAQRLKNGEELLNLVDPERGY